MRGVSVRAIPSPVWIHSGVHGGEDDGCPLSGFTTLSIFSKPGAFSLPPHRPVAPVPWGVPRPRFSVMLPTYEPDRRLCRALESVLVQAPGPEAMQIAVVDDASPRADVAALVRSVDPTGRVEILHHGRRSGLAGNWNRALDDARGRFVHLLHQDDYVLPGFYEAIDHGFRAAPDAGMAFCRSRIVDGDDRVIKTSSRQRWFPGTISRWLPRIAERQRVQTPAAVVARTAYERLGGFRDDLCHALDWEMWVRIASDSAVWYEPRVLAAYRRHADNESQRLLSSGAVWPDLLRTIELNSRRLPPAAGRLVRTRSARWYAGSALRTVEKQLSRGDVEGAGRTLSHLPGMIRLLPADAANAALRRAARLEERLHALCPGAA